MFGINNKKKILLIGMPDLVLYCIHALKQANKKIVGVITSPKDNPTYEYMEKFLNENRLNHIPNNKNFKDETLLKTVRELAPDIAFVCSYNYLLPKELYEIPKLGTLNFHPSLLPDYRGANPYFHAINNGETKTGITMHFLDEGFDTGDIVEQIEVPIYDNDTMGSLFSRQNELTGKLCVETVNKIERGETLPRRKQVVSENIKTAPKIHPDSDDVKIDWSKTVKEIDRFIRALNPFFGATSCINGVEILFWDAEYVLNPAAGSLPSGTVSEITNEEIYISAQDGFIRTRILSIGELTYFSKTGKIIEVANIKKGDRFS
ncbi:MAG: methionyl-tRNA formyltransferase [bacterium]|nr:methionyl-tRNA formyltransferase [bacterium]